MTFDDLPLRAYYRFPSEAPRVRARRKVSDRLALDFNANRLAVMDASTLEVVQVFPENHLDDDQCDVIDGECVGCGVSHGDPCNGCGCTAFHRLSPLCPVLREEQESAAVEP